MRRELQRSAFSTLPYDAFSSEVKDSRWENALLYDLTSATHRYSIYEIPLYIHLALLLPIA
jgi:hypothetical protein